MFLTRLLNRLIPLYCFTLLPFISSVVSAYSPPPIISLSLCLSLSTTYLKFLAAVCIFMHRIHQIGSHLNRAVKVALVLASAACYKFQKGLYDELFT